MRPLVTPRRQQTLAVLRTAAAETPEGAVHYPVVAARLGISPWTAYGLLRDLEAIGLAVRRYVVPTSGGGRSRILFAPASPAGPGLADGAEAVLVAAYERFSAIADEAAAVRAYVAEASGDVAFHLGFWMGRLDASGRYAFEAARALLEGGGLPTAKVQAIAALGLGSALAHLGPARLSSRLTAAAGRLTVTLDAAARASDARVAELVEAARRLGESRPPLPPRRVVT